MQKTIASILAVTIFLSFTFGGCMPMQLETKDLQESVFLTSKTATPYTKLGDFSVQTKAAWTIFGLITVTEPELSDVIQREISRKQGNAVINLTIKTQFTFSDGLIGFIALLGLLYQPRTVFVSGTVISFDKDSTAAPSQSLLMQYNPEHKCFQAHGIINEHTTILF